MSEFGRRQISTPLLTNKTFPPTYATGQYVIEATINTQTNLGCIIIFPMELYPLRGVNQVILRWYLKTLPTGATFVDLTPISFEYSVHTDTVDQKEEPAYPNTVSNANTKAFAKFSWDNLDSANNRVNPKLLTYRKTAVDGTVSISAGTTAQLGTRHAFAISEDYVGFLTNHDGTDATGSHSLFAELRFS